MKLAACRRLATSPENHVWYRAIQPQHWPTALATAQSARVPSRYSPATNSQPAFEVLYLAEDHQVALFEVEAMLGSPLPGALHVPNPHHSWIILNVQVTLSVVADLTDVAEQAALATTAQELTGDWRCYRLRSAVTSISQPIGAAPTQTLGDALYRVPKLEGFRTISSRNPTKRNLVAFPRKLLRGSKVVFNNAATGQTHTISSRGRGAAKQR